jgi:mannose-1-phosphate guanylyltransferase
MAECDVADSDDPVGRRPHGQVPAVHAADHVGVRPERLERGNAGRHDREGGPQRCHRGIDPEHHYDDSSDHIDDDVDIFDDDLEGDYHDDFEGYDHDNDVGGNNDNDEVKAVVLVGGEGTRLRPLTYTTPKQLLPIVEVPMIERVLGYLSSHGIDEVVLSLGYKPEAFTRRYPDQTVAGVKLGYAVEREPLDTAGAIRFAARESGIDETFAVLNGDVLTDADLSGLIAFHSVTGGVGTIYLSPVDDPSRFGVVPTDQEGRVIAFVEKPPPGEAPTNLINAGIYILEPSVIDRIPEGRRVSVERETFPELVSEGLLFARPDPAYWLDTGTPAAYLAAQRDLLSGARGTPPAPGAIRGGHGAWQLGTSVVEGSVDHLSLVGEGALIESEAVVEGSVIGAGSVVERGARVSGTVLLSGSRVGADSVVETSIVGRGAQIGRGSRLAESSIVGDGCIVAEQTVAFEARLAAGSSAP